MAYAQPSGSLVHSLLYSSLLLQVSQHLFPAQPFFQLSPDQRRIVDTEAGNMLLQSKWKMDSRGWAEFFGQPAPQQPGAEAAAPGTVLGEPPAAGRPPGQYA